MKIELTEETSIGSGTMYCIRVDNSGIKWFSKKEDAEKFYNDILINPNLLNPVKNILRSDEIDVSLPLSNQ